MDCSLSPLSGVIRVKYLFGLDIFGIFMHPYLNTAIKAARKAGQIINRAAENVSHITVSQKGHADFVTEVDKMAEQAIITILQDAYPSHAFLGEESGQLGQSEHQWIIDPLDGTTNFLHGFPMYSVSIALLSGGVLTQGVVFDPVRNDLYTATRGSGAYLNDRRIRVSSLDRFDRALIGTGFPFSTMLHQDRYLAVFREVMRQSAGIRRPGSAALDLAMVAAGRFDGFWELALKPWDIAAGCLLIQEAGGLVSDIEGEQDYLNSGHVVAGSPRIFAHLLRIIKETT